MRENIDTEILDFSFQLDTGRLLQYQSYVIRLLIRKDSRSSFFDQEIKVLPGNPPSMDIK